VEYIAILQRQLRAVFSGVLIVRMLMVIPSFVSQVPLFPLKSAQNHAAVDVNRLACHAAGLGAAQINRQARDL
jgi:hypothetical protein